MRVLVLGGDGFCGWPTTLYLSDRGHDITIIDNLSRRKIDVELEVESLTPIRPIGERIQVWREVSGREIGFINLDLATEYDRLVTVLEDIRPDAIVHFAEQRAAPYSMRSAHTKRYTVDNMITIPDGPAPETVDLVWKALRGPEQYRPYLGAFTTESTLMLPQFWFEEKICFSSGSGRRVGE